MAVLWREREGAWRAMPLAEAGGLADAGVNLVKYGGAGGVALVAPVHVRVWVNGQPMIGGLRVLTHRDELLLAEGERVYYSAESRPTIEPYSASAEGRPVRCPVCRDHLVEGVAAVRCPGCGRWFHQIDKAPGQPGRPCWTYADKCRFCGHPTTLSGEDVWRPEEEK